MISQGLLKSTLVTTLVLAIRLLAQAASLILLARLLGADRFGMYAGIAAASVFLAGFATFGTHLTLLRDASRQQQDVRTALATALGTTMACGAGLAVLFVSVSTGFYPLGAGAILLLAVAELVVQPLIVILAVPHHAAGKPARAQAILLSALVLRALWIAFLSLFVPAATLSTYIAGHLACGILALLAAAWVLPVPLPGLRDVRFLDRPRWRENGGYAVLAATAAAPSEVDKTLASKVLSPLDAGSYAASARIAAAMVMPVVALMLSLIPLLYRRSSTDERAQSDAMLFWATAAYGVLAGLILFLLSPAISLLFGTSYVGLADYIAWFALIVPGMCLRLSAVNLLMTMDLPWRRAGVEMIGAATLAVLVLVLARSAVASPVLVAVGIVEYGMAATGWMMVSAAKRSANRLVRS